MKILSPRNSLAWLLLFLLVATAVVSERVGAQQHVAELGTMVPAEPAAPAVEPQQAPADKAAPEEQAASDKPADADAEKDADAKIVREIDKCEARIRGDDDESSANMQLVKSLIKELEAEYLTNHGQLVELREEKAAAVAPESLAKLVRRQKILALHLVELDLRKLQNATFDQKFYRSLIELNQRAEVRKNPALQQRVMNLIQMYSRQRIHQQPRKSIAEITAPLVGDNHLAWRGTEVRKVYPSAQNGIIQKHRAHVKSLIRLKWDGLQLDLDRSHWDEPFAGKTEEDVIKEVDAALTDRGYKAIAANQRNAAARRIAMFRGQPMGRSNLARLFDEIQGGPARQSSSSGISGRERLVFQTEELRAAVNNLPNAFTFDISEEDERAAMLRFRQDGKGGLSIALLGYVSFRFQQKPDGAMEVVEMTDTDTFRFQATSFAEFYRQNIEYCETRFFPLLDHLGITMPMSRMDQAVIDRVTAELQAMKDHGPDRVDDLIKLLGSAEYARREAATGQLKQSITHYAPALRAALDGNLSVEARMRITALLQHVKSHQTQEVVAALDLLNDADYLAAIQPRCDPDLRPLVADRLEQLKPE